MYAYDKLGLKDDGGWRWVSEANTVMEKALSGLATGGYVDVDVGVKLAFFLQLRDHFGWPVIQEVFGRYNAEMVELPMGEQAERDTWSIWVSQVTGHNMARFFVDVWGLEISPQALAQVADLPDWLPAVGGLLVPIERRLIHSFCSSTLLQPRCPMTVLLKSSMCSRRNMGSCLR